MESPTKSRKYYDEQSASLFKMDPLDVIDETEVRDAFREYLDASNYNVQQGKPFKKRKKQCQIQQSIVVVQFEKNGDHLFIEVQKHRHEDKDTVSEVMITCTRDKNTTSHKLLFCINCHPDHIAFESATYGLQIKMNPSYALHGTCPFKLGEVKTIDTFKFSKAQRKSPQLKLPLKVTLNKDNPPSTTDQYAVISVHPIWILQMQCGLKLIENRNQPLYRPVIRHCVAGGLVAIAGSKLTLQPYNKKEMLPTLFTDPRINAFQENYDEWMKCLKQIESHITLMVQFDTSLNGSHIDPLHYDFPTRTDNHWPIGSIFKINKERWIKWSGVMGVRWANAQKYSDIHGKLNKIILNKEYNLVVRSKEYGNVFDDRIVELDARQARLNSDASFNVLSVLNGHDNKQCTSLRSKKTLTLQDLLPSLTSTEMDDVGSGQPPNNANNEANIHLQESSSEHPNYDEEGSLADDKSGLDRMVPKKEITFHGKTEQDSDVSEDEIDRYHLKHLELKVREQIESGCMQILHVIQNGEFNDIKHAFDKMAIIMDEYNAKQRRDHNTNHK